MYANAVDIRLLLLTFVVTVWHRPVCVAIQCYSCKATANNEIEANIHCLETANLEDCNDFYEYYSDVEEGKDVSPSTDINDYDFPSPPEEMEFGGGGGGGGRYQTQLHSPGVTGNSESHHPASRPSPLQTRSRRNVVIAKTTTKKAAGTSTTTSAGDAYDYKGGGGEDYQYGGAGAASGAEKSSNTSTKMSLPTDPEHHCYSMTRKNAWESYTVEKGCKKISYCRQHEESMPAEWTLPWNFCCDKSRCNAKLVKDKPQRIFAMGCRRTDDCIQGHNTRHVCPDMYQTCPKISTSVIKMECRVRNRANVSPGGRVANFGNSYFNQFKEKKCFCAKGFYPRGPICSGADRSRHAVTSSATLVIRLLVATLTSLLLQSSGNWQHL